MDVFDHILQYEDLPNDERERLVRELKGDSDAQKAFARWVAMLHHVRNEVDERLEDRRLLVLEGIRRYAGTDSLLPQDREAVASASESIRETLSQHPGLEDVVAGIARDAATFDRLWSEVFAETPERQLERSAGPARSDRAPAKRARHRALRWSWRVGATLAVLAFASIVLLLTQREAGLVTVATGENETRIVSLADGSQVRLLGNSKLSYHADEGAAFNRYARLEGHAFVQIAPDREGFAIDLPTARVVVLGTSFGVRAEADTGEVYLSSGRVSVTSRSARTTPVVLEAGQMTTIAEGRAPAPPMATDVSRALSWTGLLIFREMPVQDVAARIEETYGIEVEFDETLRRETLTGTFERAQDADGVLVAIASALGAQLHRDGERVTLRAR